MSDPDAILCRTNASVIENAMADQESGKRVAIVGGTTGDIECSPRARGPPDGRRANSLSLPPSSPGARFRSTPRRDEGAT